jgi:D-glycero-D-manno-heptose 1,7-bisphosphate phosphatase
MDAPLRPGVFLDRDGTIIEDIGYLADPAGVMLLPGAAEAIARINRAGVPVIVVTNQSGIGRGLYGEEHFWATQRRMEELLAREGARVDAVYHCPHAPEQGCECRKPRAALFLRAAAEHGLDPTRSWFAGDRLRDVLPGIRLGGTGILVGGAEEVENHLEVVRAAGLARVADLASPGSRRLT